MSGQLASNSEAKDLIIGFLALIVITGLVIAAFAVICLILGNLTL